MKNFACLNSRPIGLEKNYLVIELQNSNKMSNDEQFFQPYSHYANYRFDLYTRHWINDDDDFELPRHPT